MRERKTGVARGCLVGSGAKLRKVWFSDAFSLDVKHVYVYIYFPHYDDDIFWAYFEKFNPWRTTMVNQASAPWWRQSAACLGLAADPAVRYALSALFAVAPQVGQRCFSDQHKKRGREKATRDRSKQRILSGRFDHVWSFYIFLYHFTSFYIILAFLYIILPYFFYILKI